MNWFWFKTVEGYREFREIGGKYENTMPPKLYSSVAEKMQQPFRIYQTSSTNLDDLHDYLKVLKKVENLHAASVARRDYHTSDHLEDILEDQKLGIANFLNSNPDACRPPDFFGKWKEDLENDLSTLIPDEWQSQKKSSTYSSYLARSIQRTSKRVSTRMFQAIFDTESFKRTTSKSTIEEKTFKSRLFVLSITVSIAFFGLITSIGFLTRDFFHAQNNLAIQVDRKESSPRILPAITICGNAEDIPTFSDFPTIDFPGLPLLIMKMYSRDNRSILNVPTKELYPGTVSEKFGNIVEKVFVGNNISDCPSQEAFDIHREQKLLYSLGLSGPLNGFRERKSCSYCFRVGNLQPEFLQPYQEDISASEFQPSIQITVAKTRLFEFCQSKFVQRDTSIDDIFSSELYLHSNILEERGILDFNNNTAEVLLLSLRNYDVSNTVDFYCNVYFFSGVFYPLLSETNISYRFDNQGPEIWEKTGEGPYYSAFSWNEGDPLLVGPNEDVLVRDTYTLGGISLFANKITERKETKLVSPSSGFAVMDRTMASALYLFKELEVLGNVEYEVSELISELVHGPKNMLDIFLLKFDFQTFEVERVFMYATMTWSEYITDIMEFLGIFTGICVFTLIVAPANRIRDD